VRGEEGQWRGAARHGPGGRPRRGRPARGAAASGPPSARESRPGARPSPAPLFRPPVAPQSALFPPLGLGWAGAESRVVCCRTVGF